jgi:hypothetical protein
MSEQTATLSTRTLNHSSAMLRVIRKVDVISVALVYAGILAALGLFFALVFLSFGSLFSAFMPGNNGGGMMGLGIAALFVIPIVYGILGFIGGAIFGLVFNLVAPAVGGIKVFVDEHR